MKGDKKPFDEKAPVDYMKMLKKTDKLPAHMDLELLDVYCEYLLNYDNKTINYSNLTNLKDYFSQISDENFKTNESKMARYLFITLYLEARLEKGVVSPKLCMQYVYDRVSKRYGAIIKREVIDNIDHNAMQKKDIEFVNSMVFSQLNLNFMGFYREAIVHMMEDIANGNFGKVPENADNAITLFQSLLNDLTKAQRRSRQENRFDLEDEDHFNAMMQESIERALSSAHYLQTGWQGLNRMLNGGFEDARLYNFIGATGGFKSGLLLNLMKQIKLYNTTRPHKDPTKRATILFLSQENNIWETFLRIFGIFGTTENIKKYDPKQIMEILKRGGFSAVEGETDINIEFRYYGNMDIGVPDIKGIVQELDNAGKETIIIIQDYIERLRPPIMSADKRNQLADVSNQLHDLAIELDVPIITASQFNRDGVATIEEAREKGASDIGKKVGTGNISESFGMLKNFDMNISIVLEYDPRDERYYLSFRRLKFRGDDSNSIEYFLQPFAGKNSKIQLEDDINSEPVYRLSLVDEIMADIDKDVNEIKVMTRDTVNFLEPVADDPDAYAAGEFLDTMWEEQVHSNAILLDNMERDDEGFIILIPTEKYINYPKIKTGLSVAM